MTRQRLIPLLAFIALALGLVACGGSDDEGDTSASAPLSQGADAGAPSDGGDDAAAREDGGEANPEGSPSAGSDSDNAGGSKDQAEVDLSTDPAKIKGARVTSTGAVQTLEPDTENQETAQENSYASIKAFGEESEGEEATEITFALVQYLDAKASGDWATACARLYSPLRESFEREGRSCVETYGAMISRSSQASREEQAQIDVSSVRRGEEDRAFVIYKTPDTLSADMPMYVEDGVWKVGALEAYVLRPEQVG